jgi:hypothetical protein
MARRRPGSYGRCSLPSLAFKPFGLRKCFETCKVLHVADRYAYVGCGSTAYSVETVYGGKGQLYTPDSRPTFAGDALLARLTPERGRSATRRKGSQ